MPAKGLDFPPQVFLEMGAGAWVRLRGYRRGAGKVALGLGFDLLAGARPSPSWKRSWRTNYLTPN